MLKKFIYLFFVLLAFVACKNTEENTEVTEKQETNEIPVVTVANFNTDVKDLVDKEVKITGIVDHVCKHGGKKLFIVADGATDGVHIESEESFKEDLIGSEVTVIGIVREFRVDEAYCQKLETETSEEYIEGEDHENEISQRKEMAQYYRDSMAVAGVDHLSFYHIEFVSFE